MINLLSLEEKKKIRKEYYFRFGTLCFVLAFFLIISAAVLIAPTLFLSMQKNVSVEEYIESLKEARQGGDADRESELKSLQKKIALLSEGPQPSMDAIVQSVLEAKNEGIVFSGFFFTAEGAGGVLRVNGAAETRGDLKDFENSLKVEKNFSAVDLPFGSLAAERGATFSVVLTVNPEDKQ
ncbi:hypothetical protein L0Y49_01175 [bacterium]|nr:hypothetical protein [bacterium]MCI0566474.1 hypothetical protein [bacterium]MCI0680173.1 hypothetical protein [bacterium]